MYKKLEERLKALSQKEYRFLLQGGLKGIEKEGLRVVPTGHIAQTPHPVTLGSKLTHPHITTDYSEALLELITPPFADVKDTLSFLTDLHHFIYAQLSDEMMWATSMPCLLETDDSIPIADYGSSNVGQMKHIYRHGLAHRYGRAMQAISGVHFNYSIPEKFWPAYQLLENDKSDLQNFISESYMSMIRNFQRIGWIVSYLFGASPAVCPSFTKLRLVEFDDFDCSSCTEPQATSLRMSDIGYKNSNQDGIVISYNSLDEYVASLRAAVKTPSDDYEKIGILVDGEYRQLNTNILQIENEYYSFVRPKQIAESGETPSHALDTRGIKYVEIRALDVNPFDPIGLNEQQLHFMEALLIFCLLQDSPPMDSDERHEFERNQSTAACTGRNPDLTLSRDGKSVLLTDWVTEILDNMHGVCETLDEGSETKNYSDALQAQIKKVSDNDLLPSARVIAEMHENDQSFFDFAMKKSEQHRDYFFNLSVDQKQFSQMEEMAEQSHNEQQAIEATEQLPFEQFLENYFKSD
ncbi:MAG: glutamate--cysteine ligase [Gammaproteobacteria bacterium]